MKIFFKEMQPRQTAKQKVARYSNTGAANIQKQQLYSSTIADRVKAEFSGLAVWLTVVGGALC